MIFYEEQMLLDLPYFQELKKIQETIKEFFPDFPYGFCNLSSRVVFLTLGLVEFLAIFMI